VINYWLFILLGIVAWPFIKLAAVAFNRAIVEHRQKQFLKLVNIEFPDKTQITFIAVSASDRKAMAKLERQIRAQFNLPDKEDHQDRRGDRDGDETVRDHARRRPPQDLFGDLD
jgi:hypothetical protein